MTLLDKIRLSGRFGKTSYVISAIVSIAMIAYVAMPACFLLKLLSIPCVWYLRSSLTRGLSVYFYINLGISRREYWLIPLVVEFVAFFVLLIIACIVGYAIG